MNYRYVLFSLLAVVTTFILHEFSHWTTGEWLGYEMVMTLNQVYPKTGGYSADWHYTLISATGPLTTLFQGLVSFWLIRKFGNKDLYPFLFTCFYIELLSGIINLINPNDLGRISRAFDLPLLTLPILFTSIQFVLIYLTSKHQHYSLKFNLITTGCIMLFSSIWILTNQAYRIVLL